MNERPPVTKWMKSEPMPLSFASGTASDNIDVENGIIRNVIMAQVGEAKGHDVHLEQEFIEDLIAYDNKNYKKIGVKARFGHPSMSDSTMGKQMGVFKNYSVVGNDAVADLYLLEAAESSPTHPKMRSWVLQIAQEQPDFIMSSIVFKPGGYYQREENSSKKYCYCYEEYTDEEGYKRKRWVSPNKELGKIFVEFGKKGEHYYTDLVESGAATERLYGQEFNSDKFAVRAIEWVQDNPDIHTFLKENPDKLVDFTAQLGVELPKPTIPAKFSGLKTWLFGEKEEAFDPTDLRTEIEKEYDIKTADHLAAHNTEIERLTAEHEDTVQKLSARIKELEEKHIAPPASYETSPAENADGNEDVLLCETTRRAMKSKFSNANSN